MRVFARSDLKKELRRVRRIYLDLEKELRCVYRSETGRHPRRVAWQVDDFGSFGVWVYGDDSAPAIVITRDQLGQS